MRQIIFDLYDLINCEEEDKVLKFLKVNLQISEYMYEERYVRTKGVLKDNIEILNILMNNYLTNDELEKCLSLANTTSSITYIDEPAEELGSIMLRLIDELRDSNN